MPQPACRPPGGLRCPKCGSVSHHVLYTRDRPNARRRVRGCGSCGRRFCTTESLAG